MPRVGIEDEAQAKCLGGRLDALDALLLGFGVWHAVTPHKRSRSIYGRDQPEMSAGSSAPRRGHGLPAQHDRAVGERRMRELERHLGRRYALAIGGALTARSVIRPVPGARDRRPLAAPPCRRPRGGADRRSRSGPVPATGRRRLGGRGTSHRPASPPRRGWPRPRPSPTARRAGIAPERRSPVRSSVPSASGGPPWPLCPKGYPAGTPAPQIARICQSHGQFCKI